MTAYYRASGTTTWKRRWAVGRFQVGFRLMRHTYPTSSDRWVLHPEFIYDRKAYRTADEGPTP